MIGIPANNKISPEQVWQENFKLIRNSMDEQYGKKIMKNISDYYTEEIGLEKIVDYLMIQDKIRDMEDFSIVDHQSSFFEENKGLVYYKQNFKNEEDDEDEEKNFIKKKVEPEYDLQLIKTRLFQYFIEELVEDIPEDAILQNKQDVVDFIKMYEVKFLYEHLIPISELKNINKRKRLN